MFHMVKTPVYRFDLYGRYRTLWTDDDNFWQCYLELAYKPKYQIWCESHAPCAPQFTDLTYMAGTGSCRLMTIIFGSVIQSQYSSLNIKFGVNRTFHVLKTSVYRFDLYGRYRTLWTGDDNFWQCYLELAYNLNTKFRLVRTLHILKTTVYRFDLYGRYQTLLTNDDDFLQYYLELVYKPKYQIWCESDVSCTQDPSIPI